MNRFHLFIRRWLEAGREKEELTDLILDGREKLSLCGMRSAAVWFP